MFSAGFTGFPCPPTFERRTEHETPFVWAVNMRNKKKLVYGFGLNDSESPVYTYGLIGGRHLATWTCPFYLVWREMLCRCYSQKYQAKKPTYIGCSVSADWSSFSSFKSWMQSQDWEGMHLDKDILSPGNKVYSAEYCIFIPGKLNSFMLGRDADRGPYPIGATWNHETKRFVGRCSNPFLGRQEHLGQFLSADAAHEAWRQRKHEHACRYADMQTDQRISAALRLKYSSGASNGQV